MGKMKVAVGLSGGVDSACAAYLLKKAGHEVVGVTMAVWNEEEAGAEGIRGSCYGPEKQELEDTARLAERLGIPYRIVDLRGEYRNAVLDYFRGEYMKGKTPNPCVMCNPRLKFGLLFERAARLEPGLEKFATGHYAQISRDALSGRYILKKGADRLKDQSYFLWGLSQEQLARTLFPLGGMTKKEARSAMSAAGFGDLARKTESQDFVSREGYPRLFKGLPVRPGPILDQSGAEVGRHEGIIYYTIGQRKGIGIGGLKEPKYVVKIDAARNAVIIGPREALFGAELMLRGVNWVSVPAPSSALRVKTKIRRQHKPADSTLSVLPDGQCSIKFDEPQLSATPGQSAVCYDGDAVVCGGIIQ